jgi:putative transposase
MGWEKLLTFVAGKIDQELQAKTEYLVAENRILREQIKGRPRFTDAQRNTLATIGAKIGKAGLEQIATIVTPETILRWHRKLVAAKFDGSDRRSYENPGRPPIDPAVVELVVKLAKENPTWGYLRIAGAMAELDHEVSHQTVRNILAHHGIDPAPRRKNTTSWSDFIKSHADCLLATDFFTTEVWTALGLVTHYVLFFIHIQSRKVYLAGITPNPTDAWMRQAARNLTMAGCEIVGKCRYLIHDRDTKFSEGFRMIVRTAGIEPLKLPPRSPNLDAYAERFVRSIKEECLDRMIFFGEASLEHAVTQYLEHYHAERTHQGKGNRILFPSDPSASKPRDGPIQCREGLGGLLKYYHRNAA